MWCLYTARVFFNIKFQHSRRGWGGGTSFFLGWNPSEPPLNAAFQMVMFSLLLGSCIQYELAVVFAIMYISFSSTSRKDLKTSILKHGESPIFSFLFGWLCFRNVCKEQCFTVKAFRNQELTLTLLLKPFMLFRCPASKLLRAQGEM